jgi:hypothetical protein
MIFTDLKPQMEKLSPEEMLKAMAFLKERLRGESTSDANDLAAQHAEMDAGRKVKWEDLKKQLGLG